jgi:hypothetical protein
MVLKLHSICLDNEENISIHHRHYLLSNSHI